MMKTLIYLSIFTLMACETDNDRDMQDSALTGRWQLVEVISGWTNETTPASTLDYKEYYDFGADSTVRKYRNTGEEALGNYTVEDKSDGIYIKIIYNDPTTDLKATCGEHEFLRWEKGKLYGGSLPCDGPGLNYEKIVRTDE